MGAKKPLIGITSWYDYDDRRTFIKHGYLEGINEAGGLAVLIPASCDEKAVEGYLEVLDGILLSGGPDIDPVYYGDVNRPWNGGISPYRDMVEIYAAKLALKRNMPVFGICRGAQVLNVAGGGTLYQDIYKDTGREDLFRHSQDAPRWYATHDVRVEEGSVIHQCYGVRKVRVNSFHHQAVKEVAPGFAVTSGAGDGIIESIEGKDYRFAVGVQWHPECMWEKDRSHLKLFEAFIRACGS